MKERLLCEMELNEGWGIARTITYGRIEINPRDILKQGDLPLLMRSLRAG